MNDELHSEQDIRDVVQKAVSFLNTHYPPHSQLSPEHQEELEEHIWAVSLDSLKLDDRTTIGYTYKALGAGLWSLRSAMSLYPHYHHDFTSLATSSESPTK